MSERPEDEPDIASLLALALDDEPSADFTEDVMSGLAAARTALELARMFGVAPVAWIGDESESAASNEDDRGKDDDDREKEVSGPE